MNQFWLGVLLVVAIVLQSFSAVANVEPEHRMESQHLSSQHDHQAEDSELFQSETESEHSIKDCHHCGHCQGAHAQWEFVKKANQASTSFFIANQFDYLEQFVPMLVDEFNRPPIA